MIQLFHDHASTCSQKVRICLAEKGIEWNSQRINLGKFEHLTPEYLGVNPNGVVPALVHDGSTVIESSVICEYLDDVFSTPRLSPTNPVHRAEMRAWLRYIDEVPSMAVRVPTFQQLILPSYQNLSKDEFEKLADSMPVRKQFIMRMGQEGFTQAEFSASIEQLDRSIKRMERALIGHDWLVAGMYTIADICAAPLFHRMSELGMSAMWKADAPRVSDWYDRMTERPAFKAAFYPESRLSHSFPQLSKFV